MREIKPIAALYVETDGCYFGLSGVDPWDEPRDARKYAGPWPVVAHPPCQRWGKLWAGQPLWIKRTGQRKKKGDDGGCFAAALAAVRKWGGVIEHPWGSHAWVHFGLAKPPRKGGWVKADDLGGWTCCVEQGRYGHYARKPTLLYAFGVDLPDLDWGESEPRLDPAVVARMGLKRAKRLGEVGSRGGGKDSAPRIGTPKPFRDLLIRMARSASNVVNYVKNISTNHYEPVNTPAKETSKVTIKIEFTGDDPAAIAQQILTVGFLIRANSRTDRQHEVAEAPAKRQEAVEAETIDPPKKPGRKVKKQETVEEKEDVEATVERDDAVPAGADDAAEESVSDAGADSAGPGAAAEGTGGGGTDTPGKNEAYTPPMTIDDLRKYTVGYLTFAHKKLDDQKAEFADLLGQFGVTKIGDLPADKIGEMKALVDERKAKLADA